METEHRKELEKRHKKFMKGKELNVLVINTKIINAGKVEIRSLYHSIEEAEHKLTLDMMTNAFYGFEEPIKVFVKVTDIK
jgi:hypothetical protein